MRPAGTGAAGRPLTPCLPQAEPQPHLAGADVRAAGVLQDRHGQPPAPGGRRPVGPCSSPSGWGGGPGEDVGNGPPDTLHRYEKDVHLFKSKVVDSVKLCTAHLFDQPKIEDPYAIR